MIQCNRCSLQYIGETKRRLKDRFNEHRRCVDKTNTKSKPTTVAEHFLSHPNHCHTDMQLIPLELIHSSRDSIRKARESFLIDLAKTLEPHIVMLCKNGNVNKLLLLYIVVVTVWIDVMNRKTCNLRKPFLSLFYFICFVRHFRHSFDFEICITTFTLYNIVISFL